MSSRRWLSYLALSTLVVPLFAQRSVDGQPAGASFRNVRIVRDVVYQRANGWDGKLDIYAQRASRPAPIVMFIHGGGWVQGTKESSVDSILPYIALGYSVVNVEYRLANVSRAPAAIEDCRCALRWIVAHAGAYNLDARRVVVVGASAGGHLALTTAMAPRTAGFDRSCPTLGEPRVVAIVDYFGITDVADLLGGPDKKPFPEHWPYAVAWLGNQPNRAAIAQSVSPLRYVRPGVPPTISVHGDADPIVPYAHSVRLHEQLQKVGVAHELVRIVGGGHGNFRADQWQRIDLAIQKFLATHAGG